MNKKRQKMKATFAAGAAIVGMIALTTLKAGAAPIAIVNSDFEFFNPSDGTSLDWTGGGITGSNSPNYLNTTTGNGTSGTTFGVTYANGDPNDVNPSSLDQTTAATVNMLGSTVVTGDTLTLKVAIGQLFQTTQEDYVGAVNLLIGTNVVSDTLADVPTLVDKGFAELTLTYTVQAGDSGAIGIDLTAPNPNDEDGNASRRFYNNVTLDSGSVPEPSTWAMLLTGTALLVGLRRFRREV